MKPAKYLKFVPLMGAAGLLMASFFALAQTVAPTVAPTAAPALKEEIEVTLTAKRVEIDADKKEKLLEAKSVKPGEVIEYQVTSTNKGKTPAPNLFVTLPIPEGTDFQRNTVKPVGAKATIGNGRFEAIPLKRKVKLPNGKEEEIEVPLSEYRALQWSLGELAAGKSVVVVARVRVSDAPTPAPAPATPPTPAGAPAAKGGQK